MEDNTICFLTIVFRIEKVFASDVAQNLYKYYDR